MQTYNRAEIDKARTLLDGFLDRTGISGPDDGQGTRYLWTDAFAVQTCFGLANALEAPEYHAYALALIEAVHTRLGRHRKDDPNGRSGWISGLPEAEGHKHPTLGGLRIGKPSPERALGEPIDEHREWERDGQYFHYLTRWMQALLRAWRETSDERYAIWAGELAEASSAFVITTGPQLRMYWKMNVDLSRPLITGMGAHDPLDGLVCVDAIRREAPRQSAKLKSLQDEFAALCRNKVWATPDPLGIGGLLLDLSHLCALTARGESPPEPLTITDLLMDGVQSLDDFFEGYRSSLPAKQRLAFRECGLSLGLRVLNACMENGLLAGFPTEQLQPIESLADEIEAFWTDPTHRTAETWTDHEDINAVMLAASLAATEEPWAYTVYSS